MLEALFEIGPLKVSFGEEIPVEWPDLAAYKASTEAVTERWELVTLRRMSVAYHQGKHDGKDVTEDPPDPPKDDLEDDDEWLTSPN
jgi:hypothetical protein